MLEGKERQQQDIDQPGIGCAALITFVDGFGNGQVVYKPYGIQKCHQKYDVTNDPVEEKYKLFQGSLLCVWLIKYFVVVQISGADKIALLAITHRWRRFTERRNWLLKRFL
jgi:hypothetical protein